MWVYKHTEMLLKSDTSTPRIVLGLSAVTVKMWSVRNIRDTH